MRPGIRPEFPIDDCEKALLLSNGDDSAWQTLVGGSNVQTSTPAGVIVDREADGNSTKHVGDVCAVRVSDRNKPGKGVHQGVDAKGRGYLFKIGQITAINDDGTLAVRYEKQDVDGVSSFTGGVNPRVQKSKLSDLPDLGQTKSELQTTPTTSGNHHSDFDSGLHTWIPTVEHKGNKNHRQRSNSPPTLNLSSIACNVIDKLHDGETDIPPLREEQLVRTDENGSRADSIAWFLLVAWAQRCPIASEVAALNADALVVYFARHALVAHVQAMCLARAPRMDIGVEASDFLDAVSQMFVGTEGSLTAVTRPLFAEANPRYDRLQHSFGETIQSWLHYDKEHVAEAIRWAETSVRRLTEHPVLNMPRIAALTVESQIQPSPCGHFVQRHIRFPGAAQLRVELDHRVKLGRLVLSFGLNLVDAPMLVVAELGAQARLLTATQMWHCPPPHLVTPRYVDEFGPRTRGITLDVPGDSLWYCALSYEDDGASFGADDWEAQYRFTIRALGGASDRVEISETTSRSRIYKDEFGLKTHGSEKFSVDGSVEELVLEVEKMDLKCDYQSSIELNGKRLEAVLPQATSQIRHDSDTFTLAANYFLDEHKHPGRTKSSGTPKSPTPKCFTMSARVPKSNAQDPSVEEAPPATNLRFSIFLAAALRQFAPEKYAELHSSLARLHRRMPRAQSLMLEAFHASGAQLEPDCMSALVKTVSEHVKLELNVLRQHKRVLVSAKLAKMLGYLATQPNGAIAAKPANAQMHNGIYEEDQSADWLRQQPLIVRFFDVGAALLAGTELPGRDWFLNMQSKHLTDSAGVSTSWKWSAIDREIGSTNLTDDDTAVCKHGNHPDFSTTLGTSEFATGMHEWEVEFRQVEGCVIGVTSRSTASTWNQERFGEPIWRCGANSWYWRQHGELAFVREGDTYDTTVDGSVERIRSNVPIVIKLDMDQGQMECLVGSTSCGVITGITGTVRPFVCLDSTNSLCRIRRCKSTPQPACAFVDTPLMDFEDAFATQGADASGSGYPLEMDSQLVLYANERAQGYQTSLRRLDSNAELFDKTGNALPSDTLGEPSSEEIAGAADHGGGCDMLTRSLSTRPSFGSAPTDGLALALAVPQLRTGSLSGLEGGSSALPRGRGGGGGIGAVGGRLCDKSQQSLRARFEILRVYNLLLESTLPFFDFHNFGELSQWLKSFHLIITCMHQPPSSFPRASCMDCAK
eukprot:SAG11_NODE_104_length_16539_cov_8.526642_16_plen_1207_part_00